MKKVMLITGSSRGIGKAFSEYFSRDYQIVRVSRTEGDLIGDVSDDVFREKLIREVTPDVFINNAGVVGTDQSDQTFQINYVAAAMLELAFYKKMKSGYIFNIVSARGDFAYPGITEAEIAYYSSKHALTLLGQSLQKSRNRKVKITNLEVGFVETDFANIKQRYQNKTDFFKDGLRPMSTECVVKTAEWILNQPEHVCISHLKIDNFNLST